ncbi:MAG: penicillin-binding protein 1A [Bdellovibrionia bacterium]
MGEKVTQTGMDRSEESWLKKRLPGHWVVQLSLILVVCGSFFSILGAGLVYWSFARDLPRIITVEDYRPLGVTRIFGLKAVAQLPAPGSPFSSPEPTPSPAPSLTPIEIGEFYKERRYLIPYEKFPDHVVKAFISAEDDRFFEHGGINLISMLRASLANFRAGRVVQGGSTITQQVAKSLLLTPERSLSRKIKEVILASRIEKNLTKQQILYLYLNQIYLGHGAYGAQAASRTYFQKDIGQISIAEAALMAGMPQAPGKYSPLLNPKRAKERQLYVLRRMYENRFISEKQWAQATQEPLKVFQDDDLNNKYAPYYVEHLRRYLVEKYGEKAVYEDGITVYTPLQVDLAQAATRSLRDGLLQVDKRIGYRGIERHLAQPQEIEKFLSDQRRKLIEKKLGYQMLLADGRLDPIEAMKFGGIQSEAALLEPNELYPAVVTGFDPKRKTARVMVGAAKGELSFDRMKWARNWKDERSPIIPRFDSGLPSQVFHVGDVIWVSWVNSRPLGGVSKKEEPELSFALEQKPQIQGAVYSMDVSTGEVLAMVGGFDFMQSEFNRATQAQRQPGSAFKPIIYASALEKGFTPASIIVDSPIIFRDTEGTGAWKPNNYDEKFYGDTTFRQALIKSRNIPTVKIVQAVQVPYLIQYAKRLGINGQFNPDLSIALGSSAISLKDLTQVYALFPRLGRKVESIFVNQIQDRDGKVLEENKPAPLPAADEVFARIQQALARENASLSPVSSTPKIFPTYPLESDPDQVLDPRVAYVMTHLMKEVVSYGTGQEAKNLGRVSAGKTGTTNESLDTWFMGFTPHVVTGVWVGFDHAKPIGSSETGARVALPIWLNYMKAAVKSRTDVDFPVPPGVVFTSIDATTGKPVSQATPSSISEAFVSGSEPTQRTSQDSEAVESASDFFKEDTE